MSEFLAMGGYAAFVWPAYGVSALMLIGLLATTLRQLKRNERALEAAEARRPARRSR